MKAPTRMQMMHPVTALSIDRSSPERDGRIIPTEDRLPIQKKAHGAMPVRFLERR
jgi:hypothetical protein